MKKKSIILAVSAVIVATMVCVVVACTKDVVKQNEEEIPVQVPKTPVYVQHIWQDENIFWFKCDSAYLRDSATFEYLCLNHEVADFLQFINIPNGLFADFRYWLSMVPVLQSLEEENETDDICHVCVSHPLDVILTIEQQKPLYAFMSAHDRVFDELVSCHRRCGRRYSMDSDEYLLCMFACDEDYFINNPIM